MCGTDRCRRLAAGQQRRERGGRQRCGLRSAQRRQQPGQQPVGLVAAAQRRQQVAVVAPVAAHLGRAIVAAASRDTGAGWSRVRRSAASARCCSDFTAPTGLARTAAVSSRLRSATIRSSSTER